MFQNKEHFKASLIDNMEQYYGKSLEESTTVEKYLVLARMVRTAASERWKESKGKVRNEQKKQMYYFSLEFLMGRMLANNLMNLGVYGVVKDGLEDLGIDINEIEDVESDAGLGNGGLGRLAACFLDSLASMGYPGNGNTIRYQYGLFKQMIVNNEQIEVPDQWLRLGNPWEVRKPDKAVTIRFYGHVNISRDEYGQLVFEHVDSEDVVAVPYDMPIVGDDGKTTNTLRMWSAEPSDHFAKDFRKYLSDVNDICLNVYPDDSTEYGKYLRIKQEYFFVSAGLHSIIREHMQVYGTLSNFHEKVVIQLNDTHPALAIPELMRILMDDYHYDWDTALYIAKNTFAYTNHTVLSEALEKWPVEYIRNLLPRIYLIIEELDRKFEEFVRANNETNDFFNRVRIIGDGNVRMAHLSIVGSFSVNGVAKLHTDILINDVFKDFYKLYPEKFNNKTNGITHRRWLLHSNPELTNLLRKYIGDDFLKDISKIAELEKYVDDPKLQEEFLAIKKERKIALSKYLDKLYGIKLDENSIFDTQAKRLHAYKRQLLNVMHIIYLYERIKSDPEFTMPKTTFIFGAKAASSYYFAKKVIKLINCVAEVIDNDPLASKYIKVVFIPNYRVTIAEKLMNASDVSEQISTAGKEASGTGNMKFMMNGAVTLGTLDGANVEIADLVKDDNIVIFGLHSDEVVALKNSHYDAYNYYRNDPRLQAIIEALSNGTFSSVMDDFKVIVDELLINGDEYMLLADFDAYVKAHEKVNELYADKHKWARMCLVNIAKSGYFSSDRTIDEYAKTIWHITKK